MKEVLEKRGPLLRHKQALASAPGESRLSSHNSQDFVVVSGFEQAASNVSL